MTISKTIPLLPTGPKLTDDEWETLKQVLSDWGSIEQDADWLKVKLLKEKLKVE